MLKNLSILVTGGTGSFGQTFVPMTLKKYNPKKMVIFSRDEMKQWEMSKLFKDDPRVRFIIGDVRDKDRLYRALDGIDIVVCITEGVPVQDMVKVKNILKQNNTRLIGPNCPGIITVDECKLGIMPGFICKKGNIGVVSKSGTLTYEAIDQLVNVGLGQTTAVGIGGDPIIGTTMRDCLELFELDQETQGVVIIGEIGGQMEIEAAKWAKSNMTKPIVGFIAGQTAPPGRRMGHAGAIVSGGDDTAEAKMRILNDCGIEVAESVATIGNLMKEIMERK